MRLSSAGISSFIAIIYVSISGLAQAANYSSQDREMFIDGLAHLILAEKPCALTYNQQAIAAYITDNVPEADMNFISDLSDKELLYSEDIAKMQANPTSKTVYCTMEERLASHLGFLASSAQEQSEQK